MKHPLAFGAVLYVALMTIAAARAQAPRPLYIDSGTTSPMTVSFTSGSNGYSEIVQAFYATSSNNVLIVSNTGTLLNASASTYIGYNGSGGNNLTIAGGGVFNGTTAFVGYTTNTASNSVLVTGAGSSWTNSGDLNFGHYSSGNSMVVSDGGLVSAAYLYMSRFAGGGNTIQVTGLGSRLVANSGFEIGEAGTGGNSVTISNGGRVENNSGYGFIGYAATASNNSVTVTGTNSRWSNSPSFGFYVGYQSSGNNLVISNGGGVNSTGAGIGDAVNSSNNSVLVTGAGSFWSNSGSMTLGNFGAGNSLVISDGARVVSSSGLSLGQFAGSTNNSVLVTGLGSSYNSTNSLLIGPRGGGVFTVVDGGSMAARDITIASEAGSSGVLNVGYGATISTGTITITTGATNSTGTLNFIDSVGSISETTFGASTVTFGIGTATINMNQGNAVTIASRINGGGTLNQLGPGQTFLSGNNTFFTGSTVISGGSLWVTGTNALGSSKVTLDGGLLALPYGVTLFNSFDWNSSGSIYLGGSSSSVSPLTMAGGTLTLTGSSLHTFSLDYTYRLSTDPAQILVGVGGNSASQFGVSGRDNYALFVSNNTLWVTLGNLYVGTNSTPATKSFTSGTLEYNNTYVGFSPTASNNTLNVSNAGTVLTNYTDLYVGYEGSSNTMQVADGGTVANAIAYIGYTNTSSNNSVLVTGTNSLWTNSRDLYVGYEGSGNSVVISNGGTVASQVLVLGGSPESVLPSTTSSNNSMLVTGEGSVWNGQAIFVGFSGSSNSLVISNGGTVAANNYSIIGVTATSSNNSVLVTGTNSLWTNSGDLYVGYEGSGNSVVISNGGTVAVASNSYIGYTNTSSNNSVLVTGTNSLWSNSEAIVVGTERAGNSLVISNGGTVQSQVLFLGGSFFSAAPSTASSNNIMLVTGEGSAWLGQAIAVGFFGSGNSLVISNGGTVVDAYGSIGEDSTSSNNSVLVTGADSLWTNADVLTIGNEGSGNSLAVANGGTVAASSIDIASQAGSSATLNIGRLGTNDTAGTIIAPTIAFGSGAGTINFNQSDATTMSAVISGAGSLNQLGAGTTTLSASNSYTGATTVASGELKVNGSISGSAVTVQSGAALSGSGAVGAISGAGSINPGNSPGILTAVSLNPGGGLDFNFEFTSLNPTYASATASGNDVLRLTDATPFVASLAAGNAVNIYFNVGLVEEGQIYTGGFYTDTDADFLASIDSALFTYYVKDASGLVTYEGETYAALGSGLDITLTTVSQSADFAGGTVNGRVAQFEVVPEPSTYALLALAAAGLGGYSLRRKLPGFLNRR